MAEIPASPGGAEPVIDGVDLRNALALLESNAAYGAVVDERGRYIGLIGVHEISAGFRQAGGVDDRGGPSRAPPR